MSTSKATETKRRAAVVTGGSRGIGAAIAKRLAASGIDVGIGYQSKREQAEEIVSDLRAKGANAFALQGDVADRASAQALVARAVKEFGHLDIAVSNAGIEHFAELSAITPDDFTRVFGVNVAGQLFLAQAAAAEMKAGGRIVLMSSVSASLGIRHHALYAASKAAVSALARNLAVELGERSITVNAIAPGGTHSDMSAANGANYTQPALKGLDPKAIVQTMTSAGRWADPEEIAAMIAFLTSPEASYVSGTTVHVDGGWK